MSWPCRWGGGVRGGGYICHGWLEWNVRNIMVGVEEVHPQGGGRRGSGSTTWAVREFPFHFSLQMPNP